MYMKNHQPFMAGNTIWYTLASQLPHQSIFLKKGDIYAPYDHPEKIATLTDGLLKVFLADETGEERFMWLLEPYSLIQTRNNCPFTHTLIAIQNAKLLLVDKTLFLHEVRQSETLFQFYESDIYQRYTYCVEKLIVTDIHNSQFKVYSFLLHLAHRYGTPQTDGSILIENIITRNDISSITGVHRTNIIKYLTHLEQLHIIDKDRKYICIKNLPALEQLVHSLDIL